jgi:hypothetical protein
LKIKPDPLAIGISMYIREAVDIQGVPAAPSALPVAATALGRRAYNDRERRGAIVRRPLVASRPVPSARAKPARPAW